LTHVTLYRTSFADIGLLSGKRLTFLVLSDTATASIEPLAGMPLKTLYLSGCRHVSNFEPLRGLPLEDLNVGGTPFSDMSLLEGMKLQRLSLLQTTVADVSILHGMPLYDLTLASTRVTNLQPLAGMPLAFLDLSRTSITDLTPLRGAPLRMLQLHGCGQLGDLSPLAAFGGLEQLSIPEHLRYARSTESLRKLPKLHEIWSAAPGGDPTPMQTSEAFWAEYDAYVKEEKR
jgi:Leucine-rich repeat (LRR) protein